MTTEKLGLTRRAALGAVGGMAAAAHMGGLAGWSAASTSQVPRPNQDVIPVSGKAGVSLGVLDTTVLSIMDRHGIPGAALAVTKDGKLLVAKGYGWANYASGTVVQPDTLFGLASLSKPITTVAALLLVDQGKLGLDDKVFAHLKEIEPPKDAKVDPRLAGITIRQCLYHAGGWDRTINGDPANWGPQICRAFHVQQPLSAKQFISFMQGVPLDFDPGTDARYSNVGFIILGEVVAKVSGQPYQRFVLENVLKPMGITRAGLHEFDGKYVGNEAVRHLAGSLVPLPPQQMPMCDAAGGWSASAIDMARFMTNLDGSGGKPVLSEKMRKQMIEPPPKPIKPRDNGTYFGLGLDAVIVNDKGIGYYKEGSYQGMRTFMKRLQTGANWVLLYNASMEFDPIDVQMGTRAVQEIRELAEKFENYPKEDLFKEFE